MREEHLARLGTVFTRFRDAVLESKLEKWSPLHAGGTVPLIRRGLTRHSSGSKQNKDSRGMAVASESRCSQIIS